MNEVDIRQAAADLKAYAFAMRKNMPTAINAIEQRWDMWGAAPQQVAEFLGLIAAGATRSEALEAVYS